MQRITRKESANFTPNKVKTDEKHVVFALDDTDIIQRQARRWTKLKNEYYEKLLGREFKAYEEHLLPYRVCIASLSDMPIFRNIDPNEVLYIYCHGFSSNDEKDCEPENTKLWIKNFNKDAKNNSTKKSYTPAEFLQFLKEQGLNIKHKKLKIAACYSDRFATELFKISCDIYKDMSIVGYKGQLIVAQGRFGEKFAGLFPGVDGSLLEITGDHTELNSTLWALDKNNAAKFSASKNRVVCNATNRDEIEIKEQAEGQQSESSNTSTAVEQTLTAQNVASPDLNETAAMERLNINSESIVTAELTSSATKKANTRDRFGWVESSQNRKTSPAPRQDKSADENTASHDSAESPERDTSEDDDTDKSSNTTGLGH